MACHSQRIRRFQFNLPQRIAAVLLAVFLVQGLWLIGHQALTARDSEYARCGRQMWERPRQLNGSSTGCGNIHDEVLAYRLAGLPLSLLAGRAMDHFRKPGDRVAQTEELPGGLAINTEEQLRQFPYLLFLLRLPFLGAGCLLGGGLWWVTRRLYGNLGGYTALALYCFSPAVLKACVTPNAEALASLGVYGGVYTCIGVAHAMQGPRRKWRPRIVLLTVIFAVAAASHLAALAVMALLGLAAMLWVAEGRRSQVPPVVLVAMAGALAVVFACCGFSPAAFAALFHSPAGFQWLSLDPGFFSTPGNAGITLAAVAAVALFLAMRKSWYFGNIAPLLCALVLMALGMTGVPGSPWLWALPFLLTFVGGVFADAYESRRGRLALAAAGVLVLLQAVFCVWSLPGLL